MEVRLDDAPTDIVREGFDVAIRIATSLAPSVIARHLGAVQTVLCASPDYVKRRGAPKVPSDLADHECLIHSDNPAPEIWEFLHDGAYVEQRVSGSTRANNGELLTVLAVAGTGITLHPTFVVGDRLASGDLVPLMERHPPRPRMGFAVYPSRRFIPAMVRVFTDFVAAELAE